MKPLRKSISMHRTIGNVDIFVMALFLIIAITLPTRLASADQQTDARAHALAYITQTLAMPAFSGGDFTQTRTLAGFNHPLQSTGRYYYWEDQGLYWETNTPFFRASTFSPSRIISWSAPDTISSTEKPGIIQKEINKVLTALLSGDISALANVFSVHAEVTQANTSEEEQAGHMWSAQLTPQRPTTRKVITSITLSGGKVLQQLSIQSANGDSTHIRFSNNIASSAPNPEQCALFLPEDETRQCQPATLSRD